jgi:hypothetical protein
MFLGVRRTHLLALTAAAVACGRDASRDVPAASPLERVIDDALHKRFGVAVSTRCPFYIPVCRALLPDGTALPISLRPAGADLEWRVDGLVIATDAIEAYLRDELGDLGAAQGVRCAPRIRRVEPDDRIECWLANGGKAFVIVRKDGTTSVELALDAAAANARSEVITPKRDHELTHLSRTLERGGADDDDEPDPVPAADADPR